MNERAGSEGGGDRERRLALTRAKLERIAVGLQQVLPIEDVRSTFLGISLTLMIHELGKDQAAQFLRDLADELERSGDFKVGRA